MADGINRCYLLGNLGADPELRFTQGGQAVLNLRLATTESYLDKDKNRKEVTDWHSIVVWGPRGEALAKFLKKGMGLMIERCARCSGGRRIRCGARWSAGRDERQRGRGRGGFSLRFLLARRRPDDALDGHRLARPHRHPSPPERPP